MFLPLIDSFVEKLPSNKINDEFELLGIRNTADFELVNIDGLNLNGKSLAKVNLSIFSYNNKKKF
jgi:hypothetical protein